MVKKKSRIFTIVVLASLLMAIGCTSGTPTADVPTATSAGLSPTDIIKTYQAELTLTAQVTPLPSETIPALTAPPETGTPVPTLTVAEPALLDKAEFIGQTPIDGAQMGVNDKFDMVWTVENIGSTTWTRRFTVRYFSGWAIGERNIYYLSGDVAPGAQANLVVDMVAPKDPGTYTTNWVLSNAEGVNFQVLTLTLKVIRGNTATPTGLPTPTFDPSNPPG